MSDRLGDIERASVEQLRHVLTMDGLQKSVRLAAERRLRKLEKGGGK